MGGETMIKVTDVASEKFKELAAKEDNPDQLMLRISFGGISWGGPQLILSLDETKQKGDIVVESNGMKVVYNKQVEAHINKAKIDYRDKWYNRGFRLVNLPFGSC